MSADALDTVFFKVCVGGHLLSVFACFEEVGKAILDEVKSNLWKSYSDSTQLIFDYSLSTSSFFSYIIS